MRNDFLNYTKLRSNERKTNKSDYRELKDSPKGENLHEQSQEIMFKQGKYFQLISHTHTHTRANKQVQQG